MFRFRPERVFMYRPARLAPAKMPIGPDGRRIGPRTAIQKPLLTRIELFYNDVKLDEPIPEAEFAFQAPPGVQVEDETKKILDGLEAAIQAQAAAKKNEAAKGEEPTLKDPIEVPKISPPGDDSPGTPPETPPR